LQLQVLLLLKVRDVLMLPPARSHSAGGYFWQLASLEQHVSLRGQPVLSTGSDRVYTLQDRESKTLPTCRAKEAGWWFLAKGAVSEDCSVTGRDCLPVAQILTASLPALRSSIPAFLLLLQQTGEMRSLSHRSGRHPVAITGPPAPKQEGCAQCAPSHAAV
jgi:hypothetical protein